jgi:hypothetical protein
MSCRKWLLALPRGAQRIAIGAKNEDLANPSRLPAAAAPPWHCANYRC